jgi:hypothetical protein
MTRSKIWGMSIRVEKLLAQEIHTKGELAYGDQQSVEHQGKHAVGSSDHSTTNDLVLLTHCGPTLFNTIANK